MAAWPFHFPPFFFLPSEKNPIFRELISLANLSHHVPRNLRGDRDQEPLGKMATNSPMGESPFWIRPPSATKWLSWLNQQRKEGRERREGHARTQSLWLLKLSLSPSLSPPAKPFVAAILELVVAVVDEEEDDETAGERGPWGPKLGAIVPMIMSY